MILLRSALLDTALDEGKWLEAEGAVEVATGCVDIRQQRYKINMWKSLSLNDFPEQYYLEITV